MINPRSNDPSGPPSFSVFGLNPDLAHWLEPNLFFEQTHGMANWLYRDEQRRGENQMFASGLG